jgi:hypothetical protein
MNRIVPALILCLAAVMALVFKAPPKVRENISTYYRTLTQGSAARAVFTPRVEHKPAPKPAPAKPAAKPATTANAGPQVTVLGGIAWERSPQKPNVMGSHPQTHRTQQPTEASATTAVAEAPVENTRLITSEAAPAPSE